MCSGGDEGCCRFRGGCVHCLGWTLIVLGIVGAVLAVVLDVLYAQYFFAPITMINGPIWGGVFVIVTGGLAVCSGRNPEKKGKMVAALVLSIFATMAAMCVWILAMLGLFIDGPQCGFFRRGPDRWFSGYLYSWYGLEEEDDWKNINCTPAYALHALLIVIGLLEVALALAVSIMSCCGTCCAPRNETQGAAYTSDGQQVIIIQGGAGPGQPSPQPGQKPYPVQQLPTGQQQLYPGQQPPYPVQPSPGQQPPYQLQPIPGQQPPYPGQQPSYPVQPAPGQQPYPVQQQVPYPVQPQVQYSAPPPDQSGAVPSAPAPSYDDAVKGEKI
uniref:Uncharacterized protein n=1 Tax=Branchiostoma floridae TaxID=7739 RepID=C3ZEE2_BRAFL|eukprot:XP_002593087.1 hypothetical protein BRAFLDRAFT_72837 [Branchiostoma floridae]